MQKGISHRRMQWLPPASHRPYHLTVDLELSASVEIQHRQLKASSSSKHLLTDVIIYCLPLSIECNGERMDPYPPHQVVGYLHLSDIYPESRYSL